MTIGEIHRRFAAGEITSAEAAELTMALRPMRGFPQRVLLCLAGFIALVAACPKPGPTPVTPPMDADAARPAHATCSAAAQHYAAVCSTSDLGTTEVVCYSQTKNIPGYPDCLAKATDCGDDKACDPGAGSSSKKPVNGR